MGVHGSETTHSLPQPAQAKSGSPPSSSPVADQLHSERQPAISRGRVTPSDYGPPRIDRCREAWDS